MSICNVFFKSAERFTCDVEKVHALCELFFVIVVNGAQLVDRAVKSFGNLVVGEHTLISIIDGDKVFQL